MSLYRKAWENLAGQLGSKFDVQSAASKLCEKTLRSAQKVYDGVARGSTPSNSFGSGKSTRSRVDGTGKS